MAELIEDLCARRLPAHGRFDPFQDIQVLTPMYRGETGALSLNRRLQARLKRRPVRKRSRLPTPRRKTLYDDFGEPIRRVWVDE